MHQTKIDGKGLCGAAGTTAVCDSVSRCDKAICYDVSAGYPINTGSGEHVFPKKEYNGQLTLPINAMPCRLALLSTTAQGLAVILSASLYDAHKGSCPHRALSIIIELFRSACCGVVSVRQSANIILARIYENDPHKKGILVQNARMKRDFKRKICQKGRCPPLARKTASHASVASW